MLNSTSRQPSIDSGPRPTISKYLIERLHELGVRKAFGIPGDYVLGFYEQLCRGPIEVIGTTREDGAGFAADAYARLTGLGVVCVTYCVGGLSVVNSVAGAYAEKSPLIVISGSPGIRERARDALLHHKVHGFDTQREVFEKITVANAVLDDPWTAFREVDRVLDRVMRFKRPGYLEIPRDRAEMVAPYPHVSTSMAAGSDGQQLSEAVEEAAGMVRKARRPVVMLGVEVHRFALQAQALRIAERNSLPITTTLLGKSVVAETHPLYRGVYEGALGRDEVRNLVEQSDCVLMLGTFLTDINMGIHTARLDPSRCIHATSEDLQIRHHHFPDVRLQDFIRELGDRSLRTENAVLSSPPASAARSEFIPSPSTPLTVRRLFEHVNSLLSEEMVVICDVGDSLFAAADLVMPRTTEFLSPAYYTSMGFAIPAALGVSAADATSRPLVFVGDGAFQMTGMELSTIAKMNFAPVIVVLNNKGYTTERFIKDGSFNDIHPWQYHRVTELLGAGLGFEVRTEEELVSATRQAFANKESFSLINVHLDPYDHSEALDRLTKRLAAQLSSDDSESHTGSDR